MAELPQQTDLPHGGRLTEHDLDVLVRRLEALPTFPAVVSRAMALTGEALGAGGAEARAAARAGSLRLIGSDPALTARLLSLACAEAPGAAGTVEQGADALGLEAVHAMVLSAEVLDAAAPPAGGVSRLELWKHSLAVSVGAELVARALDGRVDPGQAAVCGLLHDLGTLALVHWMPKSYRRVLAAAGRGRRGVRECEREIIGVDHAVVGRRLAEHWRLPAAVRETAWLAGQPVEGVPQSVSAATTVCAVALADALAGELALGFSLGGGQGASCEALARRLGVSRAVLADIREQLGGAVALRWEALGLVGPAGACSGRDALVRANAELGRLARRLRLRAEGLCGQAEALGHVRAFVAGLAPDAGAGDVIERAAAALAAALGCDPSPDRPVVAYAAAPGETTALALRAAGEADTRWLTFDAPPEQRQAVDRPPRTAAQAAAALARDPADIAEWLDLADYAHQGLVCEGRWIGGVFYPIDRSRPPAARDAGEAIAETIALALAMAQDRSASVRIGEQMAGACQALKATRDALAEAETLSAVGEMAAGAAHELNTPLAIISGRAQLMRERAPDEKDKKTWQLIADQAQSMSDIISELMAFASPPACEPSQFAVEDLLAEVVDEFSARDRPQDGSPHVDILIAEDTPRVRADRGQIREAVLELLTNAATAGRGRPGIRLEVEVDDGNEAVLLKVEDSGPGMDEKTAGRAFTPFFSSQQAGRRRGMGLPRVRRIVETNGGRLWLKTRRGEGTTVYMLLPRA